MITLAQDEHIVHVIRKHWFILAVRTTELLFFLALPIIAYLYLSGRSFPLGQVEIELALPLPLLIFSIALLVLIIWMRFFSLVTDIYLDSWTVTNKRIIDTEQRGFFSRQVSSFRIERIQDVTTDIHGIIATFLDFGDIHVQTAGDEQEFIIRGVPNPRNIKQNILKEIDRVTTNSRENDSTELNL